MVGAEERPHGSLRAVRNSQVLVSLLGTIHGDDGITNFALPDLRDRVISGP
jgi:microcystin-dependent protein